jgi:argininosuccinate lyase
MKSQPLAYNKDNQEDKEPLFDAVDTVLDCLRAFADMLPAIQANPEAMYRAAKKGYATATDLADYLVGKGVPFRECHEIVGRTVAYAIDKAKDLEDLSLEELQCFSSLIEEDAYQVLTLEGSVKARNHLGGTAPDQVVAAAHRALQLVKSRN